MTEPSRDDPNTWQCCACDSITEGDEVVTLKWCRQTVYSCPHCGHQMQEKCCFPSEDTPEETPGGPQ